MFSYESSAIQPQVVGVRRGVGLLQSQRMTRSGLCNVEYDGRGRSMLIYQLNNPPVPRRHFHQLYDLPSWLVPLTYQDIILDMKERFPYLQVTHREHFVTAYLYSPTSIYLEQEAFCSIDQQQQISIENYAAAYLLQLVACEHISPTLAQLLVCCAIGLYHHS